MSYSTVTSILLIVPNLPQTTTAAGYSISSQVITKHISRADAIINGKISSRYDVPVLDAPLLTQISEDITAYFTYRSFYTQDNYNRSEYFDELRTMALQTLEQIREAKIDLVDSAGGIVPEKSDENYASVDSTTRGEMSFFDTDDAFNWGFSNTRKDRINGRR